MWDERYSSGEYTYGTTPNEFLVEKVHCIQKGKVLSMAEGEGRNAVFLAKQSYSVTAVDTSLVGLNKARKERVRPKQADAYANILVINKIVDLY